MKTILVVDDDLNQKLLYEQELTDNGYNVVLASGGQEALDKVQESRPDLVVLDIVMPRIDGIEAMERILARDNKIPVILNTAHANYKDNFMSWSADAYIVKSSNLTELKEEIIKSLAKTEENGLQDKL